jgi:hypothetical protein
MPEASGPKEIVHLGWRANSDGFDTALAVNRLLAVGASAWWLQSQQSGADSGDYLLLIAPGQRSGLARLGVTIAAWHGAIPGNAVPLSCPAVRLFAGTASKFPYFAYYALCLLRLGIDYLPCDGRALASGTLDDANLLILPGGFSTWGIDAAESAPGADKQVREFLASGGSAIGSCGGAFYLSAGRPGWTATAAAKPLYTHEYLQSGVGVVSIAIRPGPLSFGCPPTIEMPYYHGPIYDVLGDGIDVAATFHAFALPGRLAIDNPLDRDAFDRDLAGRPAILSVSGDRGRAVLFSPHPEMGDLVRKYIALDGYVRRYLPIRGYGTMRDTLRHYRVADAPSFRLVSNAVHALMAAAPTRDHASHALMAPAPMRDHAAQAPIQQAPAADIPALCQLTLARLPEPGEGEEGALIRDIASGIAARLDRVQERSRVVTAAGASKRLQPPLRHLEHAVAEHWNGEAERTITGQLMELDLVVALIECWTRAAEFDVALAGST